MILEYNENFNLVINSSSLPANILVSNPDQATVTIVDDDGKQIVDAVTMLAYIKNTTLERQIKSIASPNAGFVSVSIKSYHNISYNLHIYVMVLWLNVNYLLSTEIYYVAMFVTLTHYFTTSHVHTNM